MDQQSSPEQVLVHLVTNIRSGELQRSAWERAKTFFLDALGLSFMGQKTPTVQALRRVLVANIADELSFGATDWKGGRMVPAKDACILNSTAVNAWFQDDSDFASWAHPGGLVVAAAIAACELEGKNLSACLRGVLAGYLTLAWLGGGGQVAAGLIKRGIRTTPTLGTVAAAAATATVLDVGEEGIYRALNLAASIAGGVLAPVAQGSRDWNLQTGFAAQNGFLAALIAQQSSGGAYSAISGRNGLLEAYCGSGLLTDYSIKPTFALLDNVVRKPFPTLGDNMPTVCAAHMACRQGVDAKLIKNVKLYIWSEFAKYPGVINAVFPTNHTTAMANARFACAMMLRYGDIRSIDYESALTDALVRKLYDNIDVAANSDLGPYDAKLEISLANGAMIAARGIDYPRSDLQPSIKDGAVIFQRRAQAFGLEDERIHEFLTSVELCSEDPSRNGGTVVLRSLLARLFGDESR